ncbi:MAG: hypothetical protein Q8N88_00875 [Nanoarchaeota archaeon]|nr:hypothetical protein [Nanoarchaeota archaeon]
MAFNKEKIPFNEGTKIYQTFVILSDAKWHCARHELPGTQPAKAIQIIRQHGFKIDNKTIYCESCHEKTVHRKMLSLKGERVFTRSKLPEKLKKRIKEYYRNIDAITLRNDLQTEVDHRFPQVRWGTKEPENPVDMSNQDIQKRFMLLTRANNLWKSRFCERCFKTRIRGYFPGIKFFYRGSEKWAIDDSYNEEGCEGCFWYNPEKWRKALKVIIKKAK